MFYRVACVMISLLLFVPAHALSLDEMQPSERNTVEIFQKFSPKVVYVHRLARVQSSPRQYTTVSDGAGSGFIWDREGHIVTNFHVIKDADGLAVTMGEMTVPVEITGVEPRKDIAVLQIKSKKALKKLSHYEPFAISTLNNLMAGQKVIAIGNPFGLDHSLTVGVISALGRQVPGIGGVTIHDMIQTDASINPGNSGGPLLDSRGQLIGMNTAIYSNTGSSTGVGFAVSSDDIQRIVSQLIKNGRVVMAGIGVRPMPAKIALQLGVIKGVMVADVLAKTPAAEAGIMPTMRDQWGQIHRGDIIVALNGHPVQNYDVFYNLMVKVKVGDSVKVSVIRKGKLLHFTVKTIDIAAI